MFFIAGIRIETRSLPILFRVQLTITKKGAKCINCENPIWVIGSAFSEKMCFSCITGEAIPEDDYEIDEACY
jgi:hypothetical protein